MTRAASKACSRRFVFSEGGAPLRQIARQSRFQRRSPDRLTDVYFWEYGYDRALQFAEEQRKRGKVERPAVVGALLRLGNCFDLMDTRCTNDLRKSFPSFRESYELKGWTLPDNSGATPDLLLRRRDCAVINFYLESLPRSGFPSYDSVRCCFTEGDSAFEGSGIYIKSHVQLAIRNEACILGTFRPGGLTHEAIPLDPVTPRARSVVPVS